MHPVPVMTGMDSAPAPRGQAAARDLPRAVCSDGAMKLFRPLALSILLACIGGGCVTEPGPEDATVFGHVSKPKKVKEKRVKPQPIINEFPTGPVTVTQPAN